MEKFAVLGCGVVGSGVVELFEKNKALIEKRCGKSLEVGYILDLRDFPDRPYGNKVVKSIDPILADKDVTVVAECMGGVEPVLAFYRLFLLPGKAHGDNGIGTNVTWGDTDRSSMLAALRKWREEGKAPEYLVAAHIRQTGTGEAVKFIRKILPYGNDRQEGNTYPKSCDDALLADSCRDWQWG